jgi:DNA-binding FadR family transcriptional regulator
MLDLTGNRALASVGRLTEVIRTHHTERVLASMGTRGQPPRRTALLLAHTAHQRIAEAVIAGNVDASERLMREHNQALHHVAHQGIRQSRVDFIR